MDHFDGHKAALAARRLIERLIASEQYLEAEMLLWRTGNRPMRQWLDPRGSNGGNAGAANASTAPPPAISGSGGSLPTSSVATA